MATRLSTSIIYEEQMLGISRAQQSWMKAGEQVSTQKRVVKPSDDPIAAAQAVVLSQAQAQGDQFKMARSFAMRSMYTETTFLAQVTSTIQSAQSAVVGAGDGILSDDDRESYAIQLEGIRDQLLNQANGTDGNGRYIFAGYKSDTPPFTKDADGYVVYSGGDKAISQKVDTDRTMITSHTGLQVFDSLTSNVIKEPDGSPSEANVFTTLNDVIKSLKIPLDGADQATIDAASAALDKANRGLSNSLNNVLSVQTEDGTQLQELDSLDSKYDDTKLIQAKQMSALVDADYTSSVSSYVMQQAALQGSYTVFSQMSKMSLFNMNA